jgi:norsolorinic acid ketoreductase
MAPTIVLITGANRGLGEGFLKRYLAKPDHVVIAANRNPDHETSKALANLPKGPGSRLIVVKIDARSETDPSTAIQELKDQGIDHLDIVIANAAYIVPFVKIEDAKLEDLRVTSETNIYGFFLLYQATIQLLLKSQSPRWITIGSGAGSIVVSPLVCLLPVIIPAS